MKGLKKKKETKRKISTNPFIYLQRKKKSFPFVEVEL